MYYVLRNASNMVYLTRLQGISQYQLVIASIRSCELVFASMS